MTVQIGLRLCVTHLGFESCSLCGRLVHELVVQHIALVNPLLHLEDLHGQARPQLGELHCALLRLGVALAHETVGQRHLCDTPHHTGQ